MGTGANEKETIEKIIKITPRTLALIIGTIMTFAISGYIWLFATFVTTATFSAHAHEFAEHIEAQTIWALQTRMEDVSDQRWLLQQKMDEPNGNTMERRTRDRELMRRELKLKDQISCLKTGGNHCLDNNGT